MLIPFAAEVLCERQKEMKWFTLMPNWGVRRCLVPVDTRLLGWWCGVPETSIEPFTLAASFLRKRGGRKEGRGMGYRPSMEAYVF